jgi:hypothetical protein
MDIFNSNKNKSILKSLIEKSINDKFSINIYNNISETVLQNYIKKKIYSYKNNIKNPSDVINYNKKIIMEFINDFSKLNNKEQSNESNQYQQIPNNLPTSNINTQKNIVSINVAQEQENPEEFNEKLKRLQSERDMPDVNKTSENINSIYDNLDSFSSNNLQFNTLEQFNNNENENNFNTQYENNFNTQYDNNFITKTININNMQESNLHNNMQETQLHNNVQERQLHNNMQESNLHNNMQETQLHNNMQESNLHNNMQETQLHNNNMQKTIINGKNIIINSKNRFWRNNIDRFKFDISTKKNNIKIVKIPIYENSQIIPDKYYELTNSYGWIDNDGNSHSKYNPDKEFGSILFEYEKIINTDKEINIIDMNNIKQILIEKIIIHKDNINLPNTFIYINIPQIDNSKLLLIKDKEVDDYIYYINNNIINIPYNIDKYTFEIFNYDNTYIGSDIKDVYKISNINYENNMLTITINDNIPNSYINSHFISFHNLNTDDIKINTFCRKISTIYHKLIAISDNNIIIHYEDTNIDAFDKNISGFIFIETLQNIIFLKVF